MILQADIILSNVNDGAQGQTGKDGVSIFKSYAFRRTDSDISSQQPTGGTWDSPVPSGWSDGVPGGTETLWQTVSTFTKGSDGKVTNTPWTKPARVANTSDMLIFYSESTSRPSAPTSNIADGTTWKETATEATIWMAMRVKKDGTWQAWTVTRIKGEKGEDGTSVKIKGTCLGHYKTKSEFLAAAGLAYGIYLIDEDVTAFKKSGTTTTLIVEVGDGYMMSSTDSNLDGHLWMASTDAWVDCGKIKGEDGRNGANGQNAVHYELRDNGSTADIKIENGKIKLTASLNYDLYKVNGTSEVKTTGTVTNDLDGGSLSYSDAHYTKTVSKEYTAIDSVPATVIITARVNNTAVATAVCKVSMSKRAYWDVNDRLGTVTSIATDNKNHISALQQDAKTISAKVGSLTNPNLLLNSGFSIITNSLPDKWEKWDGNNASPTISFGGTGDECTVKINKVAQYQGLSQEREMPLHSPMKLTFSCLVKGKGTFGVILHKRQGQTIAGQESFTKVVSSDFTQVAYTFTIDSYIDSWKIMVGFPATAQSSTSTAMAVGDNVTFRSPKLELGETATTYCEAENDRVLATGIDIEEGKVEFTANKFNIRDNYGNQMFAVETGGTGGSASRVKLRNLAMSGLAIRDMVTMETWEDVRRYFTFDVETVANTKLASSTLRFQTCLNAFRLSKRNGKSCLLGKEEGETAESYHPFNIQLPCQDYHSDIVYDEDLADMEEAMRYVGNKIVILNESGRGISIFGRQEVTHITTYRIMDTAINDAASAKVAVSKVGELTGDGTRELQPWTEAANGAYGYYIPTETVEGNNRVYTMQKVWTSSEYWVVPDGCMAIMECVCDIDAPYDAKGGKFSILVQPPAGQSVFWSVRIGKILKKGNTP